MPLNFAIKAFSYNLARFWASFCYKLYNILLSRMRISPNFGVFFGGGADSFPIFFLASFPFPFLSLSIFFSFYPLSPFYPLKKFWPQPFKNLEMEHWSTRWLGVLHRQFCTKIGHVFSGIALPEFGRYSLKWTHVWMDLSLLC